MYAAVPCFLTVIVGFLPLLDNYFIYVFIYCLSNLEGSLSKEDNCGSFACRTKTDSSLFSHHQLSLLPSSEVSQYRLVYFSTVGSSNLCIQWSLYVFLQPGHSNILKMLGPWIFFLLS